MLKAALVLSVVLTAIGTTAHAQTPPARTERPRMIKFAAIWEAANDNASLDRWYRETHSKEALLFVGPWLRRYWAYPAVDVPAEADRFNVVRYRLTEMWYDSLESRRESTSVFYPLSPPPMDRERFGHRTRIANIYVTAVPTERYIDGWPRARPSYLRWVFFVRYPKNVAVAEGERWFAQTHGPELAKLPGLRRFVCFTTPEPAQAGQWARMCELWFDDYAAWRAALLTAPPKFTPPAWDADFPFGEIISTFTPPLPDMDFLRDSNGPR